MRPYAVRTGHYLGCAFLVAAVVLVFQKIFPANATTVALALLLVVLGVATKAGLSDAIFTSLISVLAFNFFFLPPIGTFTIADPENWVALSVFLVTAVTTSQLSARATRRTQEAVTRGREIESLYELSRAMLMDESGDAMTASVHRAGAIFGIPEIHFHDLDNPVPAGVSATPVRLGTQTIGNLAISGKDLSPAVRESIAGLIAINYERTRALDNAAAAEAARRNERFRSAILDGIAHDLKTPLTAIRTCVTRLIEIPPRTEEVRQELLTIIDEESKRLQQSITEAIQLAHIESSKLSLDKTPVAVKDLVESALIDARDEDRRRYDIRIDPDFTVIADADLVRQAMKQVLENAWKYTPAGSPITVRSEATEQTVTISVADFGPGIAKDELERIFDKFYRGRKGRGSAEGTGMGLAIAKGIIEAHGGRIRAQNRPEGGAIFFITLPRGTETV